MANRFALPLLASFVAAGLAFGAATAAAQNVLKIEAATYDKTIVPEDVALFPVDVTNQSDETIQLYVARTESTLPDTNEWYSALCFNGLCYSKDISVPPPATLAPGETLHFELSVQGGKESASGRVKVNFATTIFGGGIDKEFTVTVDASASGVGFGAETARLSAAYPNPAASSVSIPLPAVSSVKNLMLELCNARGERIADLTGDARTALGSGAEKLDVDMSAQPNGRYFFRLLLNGRSVSGPIVVAR